MAVRRAAPAPTRNEQRSTAGSRLPWLMALRAGVISVLLGATLALNYEDFDAPSPRFLLGLIAFTYLVTIAWSIWYRTGRGLRVLAHLQLGADLLVWGALAYVTGGIGSGFTFLFDLWVIVAAVVLGGRAGYLTAAASALVLLTLAGLTVLGGLTPLPDQPLDAVTRNEVLYSLGVNGVALGLVAALVSSLVARLERTDLGLADERARRADLSVLHADIIRSLPVGLATTGTGGAILAINPEGRQLLGAGDHDLVGEQLEEWLPDFGPILDSGTASARGRGSARPASGQPIPIEYSVNPLADADGRRQGWIVIFNDLTKVRQLEADLERSRRLAALGELAASLAHEIRNPLSAVSGSFQMLAGRPSPEGEERALGEIIARELQRMERLVGDVLDFARPREPLLRTVDLARVAEETVRAFLAGKEAEGHEVEFSAAGDARASADESQIRQVLWNLLRNASQAAGEDGAIRVTVRGDPERLLIEVEDSGPGIDPGFAAQVFDPFYSTRERGLGIGLALCQRIARAHGGGIEASRGEWGGALLSLSIPRRAEPGEPRAVRDPGRQP
jgi:two-component system sensor histidine kinase PilS (NtrC family)